MTSCIMRRNQGNDSVNKGKKSTMNTVRTVPIKGNGSNEDLCVCCYRYAMLNDYYLCPECTRYFRFNKVRRNASNKKIQEAATEHP